MRTPHTSIRRGKRVKVTLKDGVVVIGKFLDRTGNFVILDNCKIRAGEIKSFFQYKGDHRHDS